MTASTPRPNHSETAASAGPVLHGHFRFRHEAGAVHPRDRDGREAGAVHPRLPLSLSRDPCSLSFECHTQELGRVPARSYAHNGFLRTQKATIMNINTIIHNKHTIINNMHMYINAYIINSW